MAGTTSSSGANSATGNNHASTQLHGPTGREWAIESLIDRDPEGCFYRAARVVDDAVPTAIASRPNLITRGALIEQAFSLSSYDIDSIEKYDEAYSGDNLWQRTGAQSVDQSKNDDNSPGLVKSVDSLAKERILNYQSKIISEKLNNGNSNSRNDTSNKFAKSGVVPPSSTSTDTPTTSASLNTGTGPASKVLSALRSFYVEPIVNVSDSPIDPPFPDSLDFRQLLQSVATHPIFSSLKTNSEVQPECSGNSNTSINERRHYEMNLEQMFVHLAKYHDKEKDDYFHGVLLLLLSILTANQQPSSTPTSARIDDNKRTDKTKSLFPPSVSDGDETSTSDLSLQVGAILALFPIKDAVDEKRFNRDITNKGESSSESENCSLLYLKSSLLSYFAEAAAVYEERLEIKKARMLARVSTPEPGKAKRPGTPPPTLIFSDLPEQVSHARRTAASSGDASGPVQTDKNEIVENVLGEAFQKIVASFADDPNTNESNAEKNNMPNVVDQEDDEGCSEQSGDDNEANENDDEDDDDDEDEDDDVSDALRNTRDGISQGEEEDSGDDGFQRPQPEHSDDDDEVIAKDESSSSSSSSSDSSDDGNGDSDGGIETDEEDDAVLRQALAMSIVDQKEKEDVDNAEAPFECNSGVVDAEDTAGEHETEQTVTIAVANGEPANPVTRTDTPVSRASIEEHRTNWEGEDEEDDSDLPEFPKPPVSQNMILGEFGRGSSTIVADDPDVRTPTQSEFDPSAIGRFSYLPSAPIMLHLLRYASQLVARRRRIEPTSTRMVSSFFTNSGGPNGDEAAPRINSQPAISSKECLSLQLLLTTFLLFHEKRNVAIEKFREAITKQHQAAQGEGDYVKEDIGAGEEDDPALNFALNFLEDDTPLSSESLENKGMRRKAAAAAHDSAALLNSLRRETEARKRKLQLYSHCLLHSMMITRDFLQTSVRQSLSTENGNIRQSLLPLGDLLPEQLIRKLDGALESLGIPFISTSIAGSSDFDVIQTDVLFQDIHLYKESILLWGECFSLLFRTVPLQTITVMELVENCMCRAGIAPNKNALFVTELTELPESHTEISMHKLQVLCRRIRTSDFLSVFIPKPIMFVDLAVGDTDRGNIPEKSNLPNTLIAKLRAAIPLLNGSQSYVIQLFFALCHRVHSSALLYDGFYAVTELEADDSPPSSSSSKLLSAGETLYVSSSPSHSLYFDATKCSDSIAILTSPDLISSSHASINGPSVHQRASKVWGTVLSNKYYVPKSGTHRWAVRLDKCERGHVFIGVSTAQASMRTYVGGDKYGWGMIGTQALWHDRRKIRGDFGATFRTGSIIIVTLDSDAGTLSFSCLRESNSSSQVSLDPSLQSVNSQKNSSHVGGIVEEWGVAFEGLPLDSRLYPAVGLYQRDDRVTLLPVDSIGGTLADGRMLALSGGECYYPRYQTHETCSNESTFLNQIRKYNNEIAWDSISYVTYILDQALHCQHDNDDVLLGKVLLSLSATLCLVPGTVPVLSMRSAIFLLPHISNCLSVCGANTAKESFPNEMLAGKWRLKVSGNASLCDIEEYSVDVARSHDDSDRLDSFEGNGLKTCGKSKYTNVEVFGCLNGFLLNFVEVWSKKEESAGNDNLSCVVSARMSLDGRSFDGISRNIENGTTVQIHGSLQSSDQQTPSLRKRDQWSICNSLLFSAHSHLASILVDDSPSDLGSSIALSSQIKNEPDPNNLNVTWINDFLARPLLSRLSMKESQGSLENEISNLKSVYKPPTETHALHGIDVYALIDSTARVVKRTEAMDRKVCSIATVSNTDCWMVTQSGGKGSLRLICPEQYDSCRTFIVTSLIGLVGANEALTQSNPSTISDDLIIIWRTALKIMEDGMRKSLAGADGKTKRDCGLKICELYRQIAAFLIEVEIEKSPIGGIDTSVLLTDISYLFGAIENENQITFLRDHLHAASSRGFMRLCSFVSTSVLLEIHHTFSSAALESAIVGIPRRFGKGKAGSTLVSRYPNQNDGTQSYFVDSEGSYMFGLQGCFSSIRFQLREEAISVYILLVNYANLLLDDRKTAIVSRKSNIDSTILSILAMFVANVRLEDCDAILHRSGILSLMQTIFSTYTAETAASETEITDQRMVLGSICHRDISRAVVKCAIAMMHIIIYQLAVCVSIDANLAGNVKSCVDLFESGFRISVLMVEQSSAALTDSNNRKSREAEWHRWLNAIIPSSSSEPPNRGDERSLVSETGLDYFRRHGTLTVGSIGSSSKSSVSTKNAALGTSCRMTLDNVTGGFGHQCLSHWLHILCVLLRSSKMVDVIVANKSWLPFFLRIVGLSSHYDEMGRICEVLPRKSSLLPARYRARILRLLFPLIVAFDASIAITRGLFHLCGESTLLVTHSSDLEIVSVSRETNSLLRHLHSPANAIWRAAVNLTVEIIVKETQGNHSQKIGVLCFISGMIDTIGRGSYVLLKPPSATSLLSDSQQTSGGKSHPGGVGGSTLAAPSFGTTPHHIAGNGTEGIIVGLCRDKSSAGIVSNVDLKSGVCEVILVVRDQHQSTGVLDGGHIGTIQNVNSSGRHSLTVRALRTPISSVVLAHEFPLFLGDSLPIQIFAESMLKSSLQSLLTAENCPSFDYDDSTNVNSTSNKVDPISERDSNQMTIKYAENLMVLRCAIVVLSDKDTLSTFLKCGCCKEVFSDILRTACPNSLGNDLISASVARNKVISPLPVHEARFNHLVMLLNDLHYRINLFEKCSESDKLKWPIENFVNEITKESCKTSEENIPNSDLDRVTSSASRTVDSGTDTNRESELSRRTISQSTGGSNSEDEDDTEAAATAAIHLREAAIAQMAELGLPRPWAELALRRTGGIDIEAAVTFCLERGEEIERLLSEERERERHVPNDSASGSVRRHGQVDSGASNHLLRQLLEMGFPRRWCTEALAVTGNNVDEALTWILNNGERFGEVDEAIEVGGSTEADDVEDESADGEDDEDETEAANEFEKVVQKNDDDKLVVDAVSKHASEDEQVGWSGSITPLRFISGRAQVDTRRMEISGLPSGGFSSVGTKGILLTSGKWYYEAILETAGCLQIGWADGSFAGHCHADRGDGCGDGPSSWAYDGWRRYRWHATATEWGCRWKEGDIVGCMVDMDDYVVSFTLNGQGDSVGMGVAFSAEGFRPCGGVYACVSFNRSEKLRLILGGENSEPFRFRPPDGFRGVGEAVLDAVQEYDCLIGKERILYSKASSPVTSIDETKRFLCDFSDGEHGHELMAWAHRYYGSDASVHLGSGRTKHSSSKNTSLSPSEMKAKACVTRRVEKAWKSLNMSAQLVDGSARSFEEVRTVMVSGYDSTRRAIEAELLQECVLQGSLLARKLLMHILITLGKAFDLSLLLQESETEHEETLLFYKTVELCTNLRTAGWVGEAGAMAIAAEALGLGISSNDQIQARSNGDKSGTVSIGDLDDGVILPVCGYSQLLTPVIQADIDGSDTSAFASASAECVIGGEGGGGILAFLRDSLQSACCTSPLLRDIAVAAVRRSVRLLAVVEYDGDDFDAIGKYDKEEDEETTEKNVDDRFASKQNSERSPDSNFELLQDARLTTYLTGVLLSHPVRSSISNPKQLVGALFEAWSFGLLSASLPWRMVCAFQASGILNLDPSAIYDTLQSFPTLAKFFGRLRSTISRRLWAERAAAPVCSRYLQAMLELLSSVRRAVQTEIPSPKSFSQLWDKIDVDAATPLPLHESNEVDKGFWEAVDGWVSSDCGWDVWTGSVEYLPVDWKTPSPCRLLRTQMDGGDGPPMLREGCLVIRGIDWEDRHKDLANKNDDGKDLYEAEKQKREQEKHKSEANEQIGSLTDGSRSADEGEGEVLVNPAQENDEESTPDESKSKKKRSKAPSPKIALGTVISVECWNGMPAMARRIKWHLTGIEDVYRYGGDGGRYDICHVEVNAKQSRIKKKHPLPESREQCASRHGFGGRKTYPVLLRIRRSGKRDGDEFDCVCDGILEWPDFGAGSRVSCILHGDGAVTITEKELLFGSKDSGWEPRFGQPSYEAGSVIVLTPTSMSSDANLAELDVKSSNLSQFEELLGSCSFDVNYLRNPADGAKMRVTSEMRLYRGRHKQIHNSPTFPIPPVPALLHFDSAYKAPFLSLSKDRRTVSCASSEGRGTAFAAMGFTKGVHYWEVKVEQADIGSVFIGVAEKPTGSGSGSSFVFDTPPRLNRWHGWGFVNFRATYTSGAERVYGAHCHAGDTVGVLLDCDAGRISFFFDGLKYGEHILNDLGCAFESLSPFGFNVDGCGSGGAGQGAPSGFENGTSGRYPAQGTNRPRTLWPVVGLRNQGDRVTISSKWNTSYGVDGVSTLKNILAFDSIIHSYFDANAPESLMSKETRFPSWFLEESYEEYRRWIEQKWIHSISRGSGQYRHTSLGLDLVLDGSPFVCASACAALGIERVLLSGDRVRLKRSAGRILELAEEAVILGAHQGRLYYRILSQKSEGGSLTEGGGRAWCLDESEVVEELSLVTQDRTLGIKLPKLSRFTCQATGGLKVVYENGAVVRSDIEIFDGSVNLGSIPVGKIIQRKDVIERRVNSCGVVRFRVRYEEFGEGWISARIRGGTEEPIVEVLNSNELGGNDICCDEEVFHTPFEAAEKWFNIWSKHPENNMVLSNSMSDLQIHSFEEFEQLAYDGVLSGLDPVRSDSLLAAAATAVSNRCGDGDAVNSLLTEVASAFASLEHSVENNNSTVVANRRTVSSIIGRTSSCLPPLRAILARIAILRALNRRARYALPWLSIRPCQEGSALFGGLAGYGTSVDRAGRTRLLDNELSWVKAPSVADRLRFVRGVFFTNVKMELLQSISDVTTTPTSISHDEYELPREIRTVRINRLKAGRVMLGEDTATKRKYSVFSQLQNETRNWGGATLRRGYVAKGHGGQKRAFKVKLIGEGVNDYSGPYREVFTEAVSEIIKFDSNGFGVLGVLDPSPNNVGAVGESRDVFMFSFNGQNLSPLAFPTDSLFSSEKQLRRAFSSVLTVRDEASREVEEALVFLGRLVGTAYRHRIQLDLPLPLFSVWKSLAEEGTTDSEILQELDFLASRQHVDCTPFLYWQQRMLNAFTEGLGNVIPVEILPLFTGEELRIAFCGSPKFDVDLLKQVVEYEGYDSSCKVVEFFWETIESMTAHEHKQFLQFVWARNRLPVRASDFESPFKIQKDSINVGEKSDRALPSASTCFFSLTLPEYSTVSILKEKLLFAINNVTTMETDFQTNGAEIAEGYRAF